MLPQRKERGTDNIGGPKAMEHNRSYRCGLRPRAESDITEHFNRNASCISISMQRYDPSTRALTLVNGSPYLEEMAGGLDIRVDCRACKEQKQIETCEKLDYCGRPRVCSSNWIPVHIMHHAFLSLDFSA